MSVLETINSPADLKQLKISELSTLAEEIRKVIVDVVSRNGGHLASSLGAVELTIALHYVFETPRDKIVWDVGHQSYAHKLLTGRRENFQTLRQYQGISGFSKRSESPHDAFTTGHSSTSISAGLGMACAKRLKKDPAKVISVIGDGSMTAGLAYEGLNQAGGLHKDENMIVVLNDNDMSISRNVGALSSFLSRTFSARYLQGFRKEFGEFLRSVPKIGDDIYQLAKRSEESFKTFVTPGMLFEAFNFDYFGPINGHRLSHLIDILNNIKLLNEPVLLHVTTRKGKGYGPAEKNPVYFHGVGCFEIKTGNCISKGHTIPTYTQVFGDTMVTLGEKDDKIVAVTAAMPEGTGLAAFAKAFPDRFFDVGIAEQHGVTFAAGMAVEGYRPVVAIYSTFLQRAYDQILHDVCLESLPVVFAVDRGGIVGEDGATHHGLFDLSFLRSLPNMVLMAPRDENELRRMLVTALSHNGPIALRYPRGSGAGAVLEDPIRPLPIGAAELIEEGGDVVLLAIGRPVLDALAARRRLAAEGIDAAVVNARFVKPVDMALIGALVQNVQRIVTVEENIRQGGFGSAVLEGLNDAGISGFRMVRVGIGDQFVEHGSQKILRKKHGVDADGIVEAARRVCGRHPSGPS
ncbi:MULTISPECIES: 1-deoxy-D-xylulose-5-phosphate synthase [Desulfococcus]|uniref:1-deoxy-D-xylulose-5-phosphate synthase n=1 Tax=Desulfococcus multivorans DSM 2059 TaxID=1121405 RepID=S7TQ87_DESML|nr:1-deoxy-D-xylulose-5-phosphate synthase [Desulfococcus multivorans]AQV01229.1 1-deoxy-D-xylulose-5-phosphate synthase [Desulfococcus multivorans]EPR39131.1 1-deoxy-D-xylulose-5-phosphate synthase [Desulfococcus multivorans DSM 2059]MDX9819668.1 1-deoxy-D-xylulose-5-phosphate synthase [Desulfococcus multivorans]SJZ54208.1 1-deoxy-D-xylulose-5-phosphate synthase [Desulfococcus multivorans DSM 2059]